MIKRVVDFFGDGKYAKQRRRLFYLVLVLIVIADFLVVREHAENLWDRLPGWSRSAPAPTSCTRSARS